MTGGQSPDNERTHKTTNHRLRDDFTDPRTAARDEQNFSLEEIGSEHVHDVGRYSFENGIR
jgi:hypothetical protein